MPLRPEAARLAARTILGCMGEEEGADRAEREKINAAAAERWRIEGWGA